ncbi:MAG: hypothetical protein RR365_08925 [Bacteroides sp.]
MLEAKITIEAPELVDAINNLAAAIAGAKAITDRFPAHTVSQAPAPIQMTGQAPAPMMAQPLVQPMPMSGPAPAANAPLGGIAPSVPLAQPPKYTVDQIMTAGATLMDAGKVNELMNLLHSFGVQAVMDLKPEQLGAFATAMRELGAKI